MLANIRTCKLCIRKKANVLQEQEAVKPHRTLLVLEGRARISNDRIRAFEVGSEQHHPQD
eukprot:3292907-Prorocentrum_lima.AAC.1